MSVTKNKKIKQQRPYDLPYLCVTLPESSKKTIRSHINSVYVGTILRIFQNQYGEEGGLATAHWATENGIFCTLHDEDQCYFIKLKYQTWVVDHRHVRPGSYRLFHRPGSDDIKAEERNKTVNEIRQINSKILSNDTYMDFPTQSDRETYSCLLFRLTCNCGLSKRVHMYTCAETNPKNPGKRYYGCVDKYNNSNMSCNFFVWDSTSFLFQTHEII